MIHLAIPCRWPAQQDPSRGAAGSCNAWSAAFSVMQRSGVDVGFECQPYGSCGLHRLSAGLRQSGDMFVSAHERLYTRATLDGWLRGSECMRKCY